MPLVLFSIVFMLLTSLAHAEPLLWQGEAPGGFHVQVRFSERKLPVDDALSVTVSLTFPSDYIPDIPTIRYNLLRNNFFGPSPFVFVDDRISPIQISGRVASQEVVFNLDPQLSGKYAFTFYTIPFHKIGHPDETVEIVSDLFLVEFEPSRLTREFDLVLAPLMPLENVVPVDLKPELRPHAQDQAERNAQVFRSKTLPMRYVYAVLAAGVIGAALVLAGRKRNKRKLS